MKAIRNTGRGNITYQTGVSVKHRPFLLLRGGGTKDNAAKTFLRSFGFSFLERQGFGRRSMMVMGWRKDNCDLPEAQMILSRLKHMGHEIVPSKKQKFIIPIGDWDTADRRVLPGASTTSLFKMFEVIEGQNISLEELRKWLGENGYEKVSRPTRPGDFAVAGGIVTVWSHGTPSRLVRFEISYDTAEHLTQDRDGRWAKISGFRLYGKR